MINDFSAPIPGQSLTGEPGASPMEHPAQFANPNDALEYLFDALVKPRTSTKLVVMLNNGATCEALARTFILAGVAQGKWTPDVALLISRSVLRMITAIAYRAQKQGLLDKFEILNPDDDMREFMAAFPKKIKLDEQAIVKETDSKDKPMFGGILEKGK